MGPHEDGLNNGSARAAEAEVGGDGPEAVAPEAMEEEEELLNKVDVPPPSLLGELKETFQPVKQLLVVEDDPFEDYRGLTRVQQLVKVLFYLFPILEWVSTYKLSYLFGDIVGGLTITSLAVPQDLGYATLANVPPINGLYSSFVPPLVYSVLGTSRHIAIGPTAVISLLMGSLMTEQVNPKTYPKTYLRFAFTVTFFASIVQLGMGLLRLGWIIDFLGHATVVGFMAGAAVTIGLSQLKGLLGYADFTNQTDIVSVLGYVFTHTYEFNWRAFLIGIIFLLYMLILKVCAWYFRKNKILSRVFFFLSALAPLTCTIIATFSVWAAKANKLVPCVKKMPKGVSNLSSASQLLLWQPWVGPAAGVGAVVGLIALTEAVAIARTFAAMKGYHIDGNKEMVAYGFMNFASSMTSGITTTGSFSRSAVNFNAGGNTQLTGIIMSLVVLICLVALTQVFQYLPTAVLSAIIIQAVITLFDIPAMYRIWQADKFDFLVTLGTLLAIIFDTVELGLLVGVCLSMFKILVLVTRPHLATLGEVPGAAVYRNVKQYRYAKERDGILALRIDAPLYFTNANFVRERIVYMAGRYEKHHGIPLTHVILDFTPVPDIDTTGVHSLEEAFRYLQSMGVELGISNPPKMVLRKLAASGFLDEIGHENLFLSVNEGAKTFEMSRASVKDVEANEDGEYDE